MARRSNYLVLLVCFLSQPVSASDHGLLFGGVGTLIQLKSFQLNDRLFQPTLITHQIEPSGWAEYIRSVPKSIPEHIPKTVSGNTGGNQPASTDQEGQSVSTGMSHEDYEALVSSNNEDEAMDCSAPPPPQQPSDNQICVSSAQALLKEKMIRSLTDVLSDWETRLKENDKLKVILVMDIDSTLIQSISQFDSLPEYRALDEPLLKSIQQQWLVLFSRFLQRFKSQLFLIYNTARPPPWGSLSTYQRQSMGQVITGDINIFQQYSHDDQLLVIAKSSGRSIESLLPVPDAVISGSGTNIQLNERFQRSLDILQLQNINDHLKYWVQQDEKHYRSFRDRTGEHGYQATRQDFGLLFPGSSIMLLSRQDPILFAAMNGMVISANSPLAITPVYLMYTTQSKFLVQNVTVNKGSALRVLLQHMDSVVNTEPQSPPPLLAVFGDSSGDLTMLRPDLEAKAADEYVSLESIELRKARLSQLGVIETRYLSPYWHVSIVPGNNNNSLGPMQNLPWQPLGHVKVMITNEPGLPGLLKELIPTLPN